MSNDDGDDDDGMLILESILEFVFEFKFEFKLEFKLEFKFPSLEATLLSSL